MVIYSSPKHLLDNRPDTCINQAKDVDRYDFSSKNVLVNSICFDFGIYGAKARSDLGAISAAKMDLYGWRLKLIYFSWGL